MPLPSAAPCYLVERAGSEASGADKQGAIGVRASVASRPLPELLDGQVLVHTAYSSLNYKDALAVTGHPGVVRKFPHVPGIDIAGVVAATRSERFHEGDQVLATGFGLGADVWGGFAEYVCVPAHWLLPLPAGLTLRESMIYGTAGLTAALSLAALERHGVTPGAGQVVVTGATGGVGCLAVALLAKAGYQVAAVTGKPGMRPFLRGLGAAAVLRREEVLDASARPLLSARWAGAVDTVGGKMLATIIRQLDRGGCVAACGLVGGADLPLSVYPFILRGVDLAGIDSAFCPLPVRAELWNRLAGPWKPDGLEQLARDITLGEVTDQVQEMLAGRITGRILVRPVP